MKKKFIRICYIWLLIIFGSFGIPFLYDEITGGVRYGNITREFPLHPDWYLPNPDKAQLAWLQQILDQPYYWLGEGHQVFAFSSQDQKYVLKIFKFKRLNPSSKLLINSHIPFISPYFEHLEKRRLNRIEKLFKGYKLSYTHDQKQTGVLFLHFDSNEELSKKIISVKDKAGISHTLDLSTLSFAIQERATKTKDVLKNLLNNGEADTVKKLIRNLFDLYVTEYQKGIIDNDQNIIQNTGFISDRPIRLDVGQLKLDANIYDLNMQKSDLTKIVTKRLTPWLLSHYPEMEPEITLDMQKKLSELFPDS